MTETLAQQAERAPEFIARHWPSLAEKAEDIFGGLGPLHRVVLTGCGDSHHAALGVLQAFREMSGAFVLAEPALEASRYLLPSFRGDPGLMLLIAISSSGEVARTLEAVEGAAARSMHTLAVTADPASRLAQAAERCLPVPRVETSRPMPGLLSYLASLLACYACASALAVRGKEAFDRAMGEVPSVLEASWREAWQLGTSYADAKGGGACVFVGAGPAYGSALFGAAKLIEAAGEWGWGQDLEEWAHLEYFSEPPGMHTWLLETGGASASREGEIRNAAQAIGRTLLCSSWRGAPGWPARLSEALSPLGLWVGPTAYAARRQALRQEQPYRGFGGGRSRAEGGGASRIRSSERMTRAPDENAWGGEELAHE